MTRLAEVLSQVTRTVLSLLLPAYLSLSALTEATSHSHAWSESFRTESSYVEGGRGGELVYKEKLITITNIEREKMEIMDVEILGNIVRRGSFR